MPLLSLSKLQQALHSLPLEKMYDLDEDGAVVVKIEATEGGLGVRYEKIVNDISREAKFTGKGDRVKVRY